MVQILVFLFIGFVGGCLSGFLGIGGGVVLIPLLVYIGQTPIKTATSVSMVVIIFASASGLLGHYRGKNIHVPTGMWMGVASIFSASGGSLISEFFPDQILYYLYTSLVAAATMMLLISQARNNSVTGEFRFRKIQTVLVGILQGLITGILGIGGGFILVPFLICLLDMPALLAIGTSLLVILFSAIVGLLGKIATGQFNLIITIWVVLGTIPAAQIGAWIAQKTSPRLLRISLLILLVSILIKMVGSLIL